MEEKTNLGRAASTGGKPSSATASGLREGPLGESERHERMWVTERAPEGRAASKQYLCAYLALKRRRSALMEEWEQARLAATRATSRITAVRVSGTGCKDGMANAVLRSVEIEEQLKRLIDHLAEAMDARLRMIEQIPDEWEKTVLTQRYICGKRWEEIATKLPFEIAQVYRIHDRALQSFWQVYAQTRDAETGGATMGERCAGMDRFDRG